MSFSWIPFYSTNFVHECVQSIDRSLHLYILHFSLLLSLLLSFIFNECLYINGFSRVWYESTLQPIKKNNKNWFASTQNDSAKNSWICVCVCFVIKMSKLMICCHANTWLCGTCPKNAVHIRHKSDWNLYSLTICYNDYGTMKLSHHLSFLTHSDAYYI